MHFKIPLIDPFRWDEDVVAEEERPRQWNGLKNGDFRQQATGIFRYKYTYRHEDFNRDSYSGGGPLYD